MAKFGNAAILWTSTEDANVQRVFLLDAPLREASPGHTMSQYFVESLDRTQTQTVSIGNGAYELVGTVRYASNPQGLTDVVKAGSQGKTLTYIPNLTDPDIRDAVILVSPRSPADMGVDRERGIGYGEAEVTLRFRKTNQKAFTARPRGTDTLFAYHAGDSLADYTFTRVTSTSAPASYASLSTGDGGYGTISTAGTNKARVSWMANPSSVGPRTIPVLMIEPSRQNLVTRSENFNSTATWVKASSPALSSAQADPKGGTAAWLLSDNSTSAGVFLRTVPISMTSTFAAMSLFVKQGTTAKTSQIRLMSTSLGTAFISYTVTWSSGRPTLAFGAGASAASAERWRNGWFRTFGRTTAALSSGNYVMVIEPASTAAGAKGNLYIFGAQVEQ